MKYIIALALGAIILTGCTHERIRDLIIPGASQPKERPSITFLGTTIPELGEFVISSNNACIADIKLRLLQVNKQTVRIEAFEDADETGKFVTRTPRNQALINGEKCINANILCGNQSYRYCFTLDLESDPLQLLSSIK